jgi:hypothetical protein
MVMRFGGADRVYVSPKAKKKCDELISAKVFPDLPTVFHIAAAIGIMRSEQKDLEKRQELILIQFVDPTGAFDLLTRDRFPDKSPRDRLHEIEKYAEAGIECIYDEFKKTGDFDYSRYMAMGRVPEEKQK